MPFPKGALDLEIEAFDPRFSQVETKARIRAGARTNLPLTMPARAVISGVVTRNGKPLANAVVMLDKSEGNGFMNDDPNYGLPPEGAATDKNGRYRLLASAPRTYTISLYEEDSFSQQVKLTTKPGQNFIINRDLKPIPYGSIRGRVTDLSGHPLVGSSVSLWNGDTIESLTYATTDKAGRFVFTKAAPRGDYYVSVTLPDSQYSSNGHSETFRVRPYQAAKVTVRLDTVRPTLEVPAAPRVVSGKVKVFYRASDNRGLWLVSLMLDGGNLNDGHQQLSVDFNDKSPRTPSGSLEWDTRHSPNGRHRLRVQATDRAGNTARREWFVWIQNKAAPGKAVKAAASVQLKALPSPNSGALNGY